MKKKLIWIIDDDIIYQTITKKLIQKSDVFSAHYSFTNGSVAIKTLKTTLEVNNDILPDIILLDINMPVMDGWEFMKEFQLIKSEINKKVNIYIVSSSIAVEDKKRAQTFSDIIGYLAKPISVNILTDLANEA
jgi:CheY-like chemotaxis protein